MVVGFWPDQAASRANWRADAEWRPRMDAAVREREYPMWRKAVERSIGWLD
jgi:glycerol kinase